MIYQFILKNGVTVPTREGAILVGSGGKIDLGY